MVRCMNGVLPIPTMPFQSFLTLLLVTFGTVFSQRNGPCTTPNGESATCMPVLSCTVIVTAIQTGNSTAKEFAKKSQCGWDSEPLVCCGTTAFPTPRPSIFDLFTKAPPVTPSVPTPKPADDINKEKNQLILTYFDTKALPDRTVCGLERTATRVIGGELTQLDEFPWMVALEYENKIYGNNAGIRCGGSIINNRYVLTAAHCIIDKEFKLIRAWLGEWNITSNPDCQTLVANEECADDVRKIRIKEQTPHPFYSKKTNNNDIGLLRLEEDVSYTDYIRPICLPPANLPSPSFGTRLTVAGWGATENGTSSEVKLKVEVPLLSNLDCFTKIDAKGAISANQLCAGGERGKDSCQGDSGGPLMRIYEDSTQQPQWYQEGVVSFGVGCGRAGYPAIYTRVSRYINWIINNMKEES